MFDLDYDEKDKYLDCFQCEYQFSKYDKLLIVDDVIDSGATFEGCIRALKKACQEYVDLKLLALTRTRKER